MSRASAEESIGGDGEGDVVEVFLCVGGDIWQLDLKQVRIGAVRSSNSPIQADANQGCGRNYCRGDRHLTPKGNLHQWSDDRGL